MRAKDRRALGVVDEVGILDPRLGEPLRDQPVEPGIGRLVDWRPPVRALEVEHVHRTRAHELLHLVVAPGARRVELEPQRGVELEPAWDRDGPGRGDEAYRPRLAGERLGKRPAGLPEGEVEHRALPGPAPVAAVDGLTGRLPEEIARRDALADLVERSPPTLERRHRRVVVGGPVVDDVLAHPLGPAPAQQDRRRHAREAGARLDCAALERGRPDLDGEARDALVQAHTASLNAATARSISSSPVCQLETETRIALRPSQLVPLSQIRPDSCTRASTSSVRASSSSRKSTWLRTTSFSTSTP